MHENGNKQMDTDTFDFQETKRVGQPFFIDIFYSLILANDIAVYLPFVTVMTIF